MIHQSKKKINPASLSARRAWIEIVIILANIMAAVVALRKESVDRNALTQIYLLTQSQSLSARRAWIEICVKYNMKVGNMGRSPQGERG